MTTVLALKVHDGIVLAADSASTLYEPGTGVQEIRNVYNSANKIFNLYHGLPIGGMTWGAGSIGDASISTLVKELRARLMGEDREWKIDARRYRLERVVELTRRFLYQEQYLKVLRKGTRPELGFFVAGYEPGSNEAQEWELVMNESGCRPDRIDKKGPPAIFVRGQEDLVTRVLDGHSTKLKSVLKDLDVPDDQLDDYVAFFRTGLREELLEPAMPLQDTVDLAIFLVEASVQFYRFKSGASIVGGPVDCAAVSPYEGFKWIRRKLYFDAELNPERPVSSGWRHPRGREQAGIVSAVTPAARGEIARGVSRKESAAETGSRRPAPTAQPATAAWRSTVRKASRRPSSR